MPSRASDRHGWNSWDGYQAVHYRRLQDFQPHFLVRDELVPTFTPTRVVWVGFLSFVDGLSLKVHKRQDVQYRGGSPFVRTVRYSYQFLRRDNDVALGIFRYDNTHQHRGHADAHHRHKYDAKGRQISPPDHVGRAEWPTLGEVLQEAFEWWLTRTSR